MTVPIQALRAGQPLSEQILNALLRDETQKMAEEQAILDKYRTYYNGDHTLTFGTAKFKAMFGTAFEGFKDDWCSVVVDATLDKLRFKGVRIGAKGAASEAAADNPNGPTPPADSTVDKPTPTQTEDPTADPLADALWEILDKNDIDQMQSDIHEGALVEGRSYVIAWPDPELGVRVDANRAQMVRIRKADDDPRKTVYALKRWVSANGQLFVTVYTDDFLYKYESPLSASQRQDLERFGLDAMVPTDNSSDIWQKRTAFTPDGRREPWPLRNPIGEIPVIEFLNKRSSELKNVIPLQDAINFLVMQGLTASSFQGWKQRVFFSGVKEPVGGWSNEPGKVWQVPPTFDADGNMAPGSAYEFGDNDLAGFKTYIEMILQHLALTTKTPSRMFFESDRGGRGDAPSGESLLVTDQPLIDKVEDRQVRFGNSWYRLIHLMNRIQKGEELPSGEVKWKDPRAKYRSALIAEGALMVEKMGIPLEFVITQLGFTSEEVAILKQLLEQKKVEDELVKEKEFNQTLEMEKTKAELKPTPTLPPRISPR